jgi:hypothetical protein
MEGFPSILVLISRYFSGSEKGGKRIFVDLVISPWPNLSLPSIELRGCIVVTFLLRFAAAFASTALSLA